MGKLTLVNRKKSGLKPPRSRDRVAWVGRKRALRLHHTGDAKVPGKNATIDEESAYVRQVQRYHMTAEPNGRGYVDIAYNYMIFQSGRAYVLRGFGIEGAHTLHHNDDVGVCFAGNFSQRTPSEESLVAFWQLKRWLKLRGVRGLNVIPHRATFATSCPGSKLVKAVGL